MADPGFVGVEITDTGFSSTTVITVDVPSAASAGDKAILMLAMNPSGGASGITTPGWEMLEGFGISETTNCRLYVWQATVTSGGDVDPGATIEIEFNGSSRAVASIYVVGPSEVDAIGTFAPESSQDPTAPYELEFPTVTTSDQARVLYIGSGGVYDAGVAGLTWTPDAATTERAQGLSTHTASRNSILLVADEVTPTSGETAARVAESSLRTRRLAATIALSSATIRPTATATTPTPIVAAGTTGLELAGSASDGGGAGGPYGWQWSLQSGPSAVTFSSDTAQSPTVTSELEPGLYVFRLVVTDSGDVDSSPAAVSVNVVGAGATAVPIESIVSTGWGVEPPSMSGADALSDGSDETFVYYTDPDGTVVLEYKLSAWTPTPGQPAVATYRPSMLGTSGSVMFYVKSGASTTVAEFGPDTWSEAGTVQQFDHTLTPQQVADIGDTSDVRFRWEGQVSA